ncbi:C-type lectin domain family 1 member B-like isoform X2 [Polypterus senegalus]|uniref:C-type lectin domain family 1 member B-like isoform X2 n=1 Tax=Polypterus senegalus TaxID=55291 RepID=UPI0019668274|nr:C-type lectin domain family 1 member B-like isoform X2 [Polypterus senegalus]
MYSENIYCNVQQDINIKDEDTGYSSLNKPSKDIYCNVQQGINIRGEDAGFPRRCSRKCLIIICITLLISVILLTLTIFISQQNKNTRNQMNSSLLNNHARDFAAHLTTTAPGNQMTNSALNNHAGDIAAHRKTTVNMKEEQWLNHNGKLYYFATKKLSWDNANTFCRKQSSNLTVIKKTEELNFILNHTVSQMWVGMRKENERWNWIDGTTFQNNIFKEGIHQVKYGLECVNIMDPGLLFAVPCKTSYHWICEKIIITEVIHYLDLLPQKQGKK